MASVLRSGGPVDAAEYSTNWDRAQEADDYSEPQSRISRRVKVLTGQLVAGVLMLALWEYASGRWIDPFFVSRPSAIGTRLLEWVLSGFVWFHLSITFQQMIAGFLVGAVTGAAVGIVFGRNELMSDIFSPYIAAVYSLPKIALAPLLILWFGIGFESKVALTAIVVFFLVFYNTYGGIRDVPVHLMNGVRVMGATERQLLFKVLLPHASAWIFTGLKVSVPYALIGSVVGEMISANRGIGFVLNMTANMFDTTGVFTALVVLMIVAFLLNQLVDWAEARVLRWKRIG